MYKYTTDPINHEFRYKKKKKTRMFTDLAPVLTITQLKSAFIA